MTDLTRGERDELLRIYRDLRVADVRDGMDWHMMHHYGSMSTDIRPLYRTRACGIARTARYVRYEGRVPEMSADEGVEWIKWYGDNVCPYPWMDDLEDGDFIVIDQSDLNVGLMGSNNSLYAVQHGARGFVSSGGVRDTDEVILQNIPFWSRSIAQTRIEGRLRFESKDTVVSVGGVAVSPGDVVVADGDGVVVVPLAIAEDVAKYAQKELDSDKKGRKGLYEQLGMELDDTVL